MTMRNLGHGDYDLELGHGFVAEFTRDAHGFKFWTLRREHDRVTGDAGNGERCPENMTRALRELAEAVTA